MKTKLPFDFAADLGKILRSQFRLIGESIGRNPVQYISITVLISILLGTGVQQFQFVNDIDYLFSPTTGQGYNEREFVNSIFPLNYSSRFDPSRFNRLGRGSRILITAKDGGNLMRVSIWQEIQKLDEIVRNITIMDNEQSYNFETMCAKWLDNCYEWNIIKLAESMDKIEAGNLTLSYPVMINPTDYDTIFLPTALGGVELEPSTQVKSFKAVQLLYFLDPQSPHKDLRGEKWEMAFVNELNKLNDTWKHIKPDRLTWYTMGAELDKNNLSVVPYAMITVPMMVLFCVWSFYMSDGVKSKPWLGLASVICPLLGTFAAVGLLFYCRIPICTVNIATPFLMIAIGIDDSFVMVASWRQTNPRDSVPKRMGEAFAEAGVSITITSLTDMLSFWVGIITPFPALQIFSAYTGTAVLGTYLCHIFIFGGAMALSGYTESENRSGLFWWKSCTPKSQINEENQSRTKFQKLFLTGGINHEDPHNPMDQTEDLGVKFFRDYWSYYINKPAIKTIILLLFAVYIGIAAYGISKTKEGLEIPKLFQKSSNAGQYFETERKYFREFPFRIQIVLEGHLDYSDKIVQERIENMMEQFESSKYCQGCSFYTQSWLRGFLKTVEKWKQFDIYLNTTNEFDFIQSARDNYFSPDFALSDDVIFNENKTHILASRFIIQMINVTTQDEEIEMVTELRKIAQAQEPHLNVTVFNWYFLFFDQFSVIRSTTLQCALIAGLVMMAVSLVLIPNPLCSLWVTFAIVSTEAGVLGFLSLWGVSLDAISMSTIVMCIGFSVDFSAHISYHYISAKADNPDDKVRETLTHLGMPVVQGAFSTIFGIGILMLVPSYIHNTFFKSGLLVMIIAAAHGLLLLPVLLSLFGPGGSGFSRRDSKYEEGERIQGKVYLRKEFF